MNNPSIYSIMNDTLKRVISNSPNQKKMALVFDVETSGLIPKKMPNDGSITPIDVYPYILQIAYVVYDIEKQCIVKKYNEYIRPPSSVFINAKITEITGITREICDSKGVDITSALTEFYHDYTPNTYIVAHNISFDQTIIEIEIHRNNEILKQNGIDALRLFNSLYNKINNIELYCTMKIGKNICNITVERADGKTGNYKKFPKLSELHEKLFGTVPDNMHDAYVDTMACLKCFLQM